MYHFISLTVKCTMKTDFYSIDNTLQKLDSGTIPWIAYMIFCNSSLSYSMEKQSAISKWWITSHVKDYSSIKHQFQNFILSTYSKVSKIFHKIANHRVHPDTALSISCAIFNLLDIQIKYYCIAHLKLQVYFKCVMFSQMQSFYTKPSIKYH